MNGPSLPVVRLVPVPSPTDDGVYFVGWCFLSSQYAGLPWEVEPYRSPPFNNYNPVDYSKVKNYLRYLRRGDVSQFTLVQRIYSGTSPAWSDSGVHPTGYYTFPLSRAVVYDPHDDTYSAGKDLHLKPIHRTRHVRIADPVMRFKGLPNNYGHSVVAENLKCYIIRAANKDADPINYVGGSAVQLDISHIL